MAKLYFRYGAMGSAKTLNLLAVWHNYLQQGKKVRLLKPAIDERFGREVIRSRAGLEYPADMLLFDDTRLDFSQFAGVACVLVDECQWLSPSVVDQLREMTRELNVPVIAYGLRTDFRTRLFDGSRRLLELADAIEEVKTTCMFCNRKAVFNLRHDGQGKALVEGPSLQLGTEESYSPVCYPCYHDKVENARQHVPEADAPATVPPLSNTILTRDLTQV